MNTCEIGPNGGAGCDQDIVWLNGKWYSPHFEGSHWSRVKRGPSKPKADDSGLTESMTEEQVRVQLNATYEAMRDGTSANS